MKIVTVSREFGSGGRELGKRLADALGVAYYDREIITAIAQESALDESYIARVLEKDVRAGYPVTFARTLSRASTVHNNAPQLLAMQHKLIQQLAAQSDCVIVGRGADTVLQEQKPFSVFVYADMASKIARCRSRAQEGEIPSDRALERKAKEIDKGRANNYDLTSTYRWGDKRGYQLCVNTTNMNIKELTPLLAAYARQWFQENNI